jgi:hypothetical protein
MSGPDRSFGRRNAVKFTVPHLLSSHGTIRNHQMPHALMHSHANPARSLHHINHIYIHQEKPKKDASNSSGDAEIVTTVQHTKGCYG